MQCTMARSDENKKVKSDVLDSLEMLSEWEMVTCNDSALVKSTFQDFGDYGKILEITKDFGDYERRLGRNNDWPVSFSKPPFAAEPAKCLDSSHRIFASPISISLILPRTFVLPASRKRSHCQNTGEWG